MGAIFGRLSRRAGLSAIAGLSCLRSDTQRYFALLLLKRNWSLSEFPIIFSTYCSFKILFPFVLIPPLSGLTLFKKSRGRFLCATRRCLSSLSYGFYHLIFIEFSLLWSV